MLPKREPPTILVIGILSGLAFIGGIVQIVIGKKKSFLAEIISNEDRTLQRKIWRIVVTVYVLYFWAAL